MPTFRHTVVRQYYEKNSNCKYNIFDTSIFLGHKIKNFAHYFRLITLKSNLPTWQIADSFKCAIQNHLNIERFFFGHKQAFYSLMSSSFTIPQIAKTVVTSINAENIPLNRDKYCSGKNKFQHEFFLFEFFKEQLGTLLMEMVT